MLSMGGWFNVGVCGGDGAPGSEKSESVVDMLPDADRKGRIGFEVLG